MKEALINKAAFEALVRAEAPYMTIKADTDDWYVVQGPTMVFGSGSWMPLTEAIELRDRLNAAYIAARMEHEWSLLEAANAMATAYGESWEADRDSEDETQARERLNTAWRKWVELFFPYATKLIEQ